MPIEIKNCKITNCGTGIKTEGKLDISVANTEFTNNGKDIDIHTTSDSKISLEDIESFNCATVSISITEYNRAIENAMREAEVSGDFSNDELEKFRQILNTLQNSKNDPPEIKKIMKEIFNIGKSCIPTIISILFSSFKK